MKTTRYWLTIVSFALAILATWAYYADQASAAAPEPGATITKTVGTSTVRTTILDNSKYPEIVVKLECTGDTVDGVVTPCRAELLAQCPDGGDVVAIAETPEGVTPLGIMLVVRCIHEPSI
jgi:hypothetical protein